MSLVVLLYLFSIDAFFVCKKLKLLLGMSKKNYNFVSEYTFLSCIKQDL